MILGGLTIAEEVGAGKIHISPFSLKHVGPNSYDVHLGPTLMRLMSNAEIDGIHYNDPRIPPRTHELTIPEHGFLIEPGVLYLGHTIEEAGSDHYVPMYDGRSTIARWGVFSHVSAGFGDVGFKRQWTLEIMAIRPFLLLPGMRIGQVFFHTVSSTDDLYGSSHNYTNQVGATPPKAGNI